MYSISQIKAGLSSPKSIARELNRQISRQGHQKRYNTNGIDIFTEDWDNLVILDACRYDTFVKIAVPELPGTLEYRTSRGSQTSEFIRGNFSQKQLDDVVYASANSWYARLKDEINAKVFKFVELNGEDFRDPRTQTFHPDPVTERAMKIDEQYPEKRLIVHYVQPHTPFMGRTAEQYFTKYGLSSLPELIRKDDITMDRVKTAYEETLEITVPYISKLIESLEGKTVVTADHGEMLGERYRPMPVRGFGHHGGIYRDELVKVPWLTIESDQRKTIVSEVPERDEIDSGEIDDRLRDLGYKL